MSRRRGLRSGIVLAVLTLAGSLALALFEAQPARADGLDVLCGAFDPVDVDENQITSVPGAQLTVDATDPDGTTIPQIQQAILPFGVPNLDTGGANIPFAGGAMRPVNIDGDPAADFSYGWGLRLSTAPGIGANLLGPNPIDTLFNNNFRLPDDYRNPFNLPRPYVSGVGADVHFIRASGTAVTEHNVELGGIVDFINRDGSRTHLKVRIGLDGRPRPFTDEDPTREGESRSLPDEANISILARKANDPTTTADDPTGTLYLGLGLEFRYGGVAAADNPPLGVTADVEIVDDAGNPIRDSDFLDLSLAFSRAPGDLALGLRQRCTDDRSISMSHLSLNRVDASPSTQIGVDLHSLGGSGLPAAPGGPAGEVVAVEGLIEGLPQLVDVVMQPEEIGVTHSPDITPILKLDGLLFAPDDPDLTTESPLYVEGTAFGIPDYVNFTDEIGYTGDRVLRVRGAKVECEEGLAMGTDTSLPIFPANCAAVEDASLGGIHFTVQNFSPADTDALDAVTEFLPAQGACGAGQTINFGYRQDVRPEQGGLWRANGCANGIMRAGVQTPSGQSTKPRTTAWITGDAPADWNAAVGAVILNGSERILVELAGRAPSAPADMDISFQSSAIEGNIVLNGVLETKTRNIFDIQVPAGVDLDLDRIHVASGPLGDTPETLVYGDGVGTYIPPHMRVEVVDVTSPEGTKLASASAEACPTRPFGDPFVPPGNICAARGIPTEEQAVGNLDLKLQNFLPDNPAGTDIPDLTPTGTTATQAGNWAAVAYRTPRDDRPLGHFRAGVKIAGVRRVALATQDTQASFESPLYTRTGVNVSLDLASQLPQALVVAQVDGRTSTTAGTADGFLVRGSGVLTPVPAHVEATFESLDSPSLLFEDTPFALEWHASSPIAVTWPYASLGLSNPENVLVQGPAPDLLAISGNVEIGNAGGTGGIAPDGRITMTQAQDIATYRHITYAASEPTVVRAGAVISTATDRAPSGTANDLRTRVRAEVEIPALPFENPLVVNWTEANKTVREVGAYLCPEDESCPSNRVTATFHRGKALADDNRTDVAPPVPGPQNMGGVIPVFSSFSPGPEGFAEGVRAVMRTDGTVAGHLAVADIASVSAILDSTATVRVRTDSAPFFYCTPNPGAFPPFICTLLPDPFTVNIFVRPSTAVPGIFANGVVDDLPDDIVAQFSETGGEIGDAQPWIWFNTESVDIESAPDLTDVGGESGGPRFDGTVLVGDQTRILPTAADQFTATEAPGVKARASIFTNTNGKTTLGFAANVRLHLPRHVEIWKPSLRSCGAGTATLSTCAQLEAYEAEMRTRASIRARTTADTLGFLTGRFEIDNGEQDYQGNVKLETIPGSLDARVDLIQNKRLPWTTVNLAYTTNVSPGDATLTVYDRCLPAYVGDITNTPQLGQRILPGQCITNQSDVNKVPNYDITLRDIPAKLDFRARIATSESPQQGTPRELSTCPDSGYQGRGPTRIGYLHADLGFGPLDRDRDEDERFDIDVAVRTGRTGQDADEESYGPDTENSQAIATVSAEGELSGEVSAKVLNLGEEQRVGIEIFRSLGIIFQACIDFDLPLTVSFDGVRDLGVSMSGAKLGLFRNESAHLEGRVGESFFPRVATPPDPWVCWPDFSLVGNISCSGAPFARREVGITALVPPFNISIPVESDTGWQDVGLIDVTDQNPSDGCPDALTLCSMAAPANTFDTDDLDTDSAEILRPDGASTATGAYSVMLLDPILGTEKRVSDGLGHALGGFYDIMNDTFSLDLPGSMPEIAAGVERVTLEGSFSLTDGFVSDNERVWEAKGSDGTRYKMFYRRISEPSGGLSNSFQPELWAFHRSGEVRWIRSVGWHVGASIIGRGNHDVRISPHSDGSVTVRLDFDDNDEDNAARFDASGNGRVLNGTTTVPATNVSGRVNRVIVLTLPAGSELQQKPAGGHTRRWYLGDGRTTGQVVNGGTMVRYSAPGTYYVIGVDYDSKGREMAQHAFVVTVS